MPRLLAGWSKREISVPVGFPLAGYIARRCLCQGALDPLFVRTLVLKQGKKTAVLVVTDLLMISSTWATKLRRRLAEMAGTNPEAVVVAATHTHSGPVVDSAPFNFSSVTAKESQAREVVQGIEQRAVEALREALKFVQPVEVSAAHVMIREVATDRNFPERSKAQPFFLLRFGGRSGSALFSTLACHATVLGAKNCLASGDLHGAVARLLERDAEVALVANSASANVSTRFTRRSQTPRELARLAELVVEQARAARFHKVSDPILALRTRRVRFALANLAAGLPETVAQRGRLATVAREARLIRKRLAAAREFSSGRLRIPIVTLRLGNVAVAALPFENSIDTGRFLWQHSRVIPVCCANGYWGYMPSGSAGADDYETVSSPFGRDADGQLRKKLSHLSLACRSPVVG